MFISLKNPIFVFLFDLISFESRNLSSTKIKEGKKGRKMFNKYLKFVLISLLIILASIGWADKIIRNSGQTLEGRIISEDQISVKIDIDGSVFEIRKDEIKDIIRESTTETSLEKARKSISTGNYQDALNFALAALNEQQNLEDIKIVFKESFMRFKSSIEVAIQTGINLDKEINNLNFLLKLNEDPKAVSLHGGEEAVKPINESLKTTLAEAYFNRAKKLSEANNAANDPLIIGDLKNGISVAPQSSQIYYRLHLTLGLYQEKIGEFKDAFQNLQIAHDKAPALSDRVSVKTHIDRVKLRIAAVQAALTPIPTPRSIYTPAPLYVPTPSPSPSPVPTETPTFIQKVRQSAKTKNILPMLKSAPKAVLDYVKKPNITKYIIIVVLLVLFNWIIPIKLIGMKTKKSDIIAGQYAIWVKRFGLIPYLIYLVISLSNRGTRKRCPYCNKLIDNIDSYSDMNFFICPHCNENISAIYDLKDYIEHLIKNVQMELTKDKKRASDSVIEKDAMVKLVRAIVTLAYRKRSSDIHIEPELEGVKVRARVDGILYDILVLPRNIAAATVSAIKVMANLDIAEKRIPQDGRINMWIDKSDIDIRLNTSPIPLGEKASLRLLDKSAIQLDSTKLGLDGANLEKFEKAIRKPHGVVLVTGPTGSGKSTTLYVALNSINNGEKNIVTIEDPIEYQIKGINQMQVNVAQHFTFATGLRSILRQDPDVIMVGEIRDQETSEICIDAAMTGHLVFSTLHTIDAPTSFSRLNDLGIAPRRYAPALEVVMAQRLVRVNCNECKKPYKPKKEDLELLGLLNASKDTMFMEGAGCEVCDKIGFYGRMGLFEILQPDEELKELIESNASISVIREMAKKKGMRILREEGVVRILQGLTTVEEVIRVTS